MNLFVSLRYLVALDDHRHFGRAALACSVTQPALSNAIRALEENFGASIVKRGRNFAGFTEEGERILVTGRSMLRDYELLQQDLHSSEAAPTGNLLIGAVPTAMPIAARFAAMLQDRHPGITPAVRSMSSIELESGLESLSLDMALGYTERMDDRRSSVRAVPQYSEHYFLLRRAALPDPGRLRIGEPTTWAEAAALPLCLLSREMHNRTIVDRAFVEAVGQGPKPVIETNSILTLALSVRAGRVASVMPGALVDAVQGYGDLEALPLTAPAVQVPIAFMVHDGNRPSRTLQAALAFAEDAAWLEQVRRHAGALAALG
ncbi:LysR substrate-binding domain-containing protein [Variovorax sp. J22P168]|uniref:LysR substrate-binding domain-containing protein n=1 Tax=Variovorax jilinensis TaxID=3053513 RepID=UPI002577DF7A|nr:LysR substrate-binding domain-containing protein [Variovorax sp. J22P168]MDM0011139.1 LysR substrate-binding domain-containing protein [Variovorax sp. J22P168]